MKHMINYIKAAFLVLALLGTSACQDKLDTLPENKAFTAGTDYTLTSNMILPLIGLYGRHYEVGWMSFPVYAVRGDDVNAGGLGDQIDFANEDIFKYNKDFWMFNAVWQDFYEMLFVANSTIEQVGLYQEKATSSADKAKGDQYIAEAKVLRAWNLFTLSRIWGSIFISESSDPSELLHTALSTKDEVMSYISDQMDQAVPMLPDMNPNQRTDIKGGVTKYTALALKALANLELKDYQVVADVTAQIINSGKYSLEPDFYELFKIKGKFNNENIFEYQYSDFGQGSGDAKTYLFDFYGPGDWTPKITGSGGGWGFWEPSLTFIKFMLDRGESVRLETSVIFTPRGIAKLKEDPGYSTLPAWITNITRSGDQFNDHARYMFMGGKFYLPSDQLTPGRTSYGTNKNYTLIRYAEILLMYAEALTQGATGSAGTADDAVNLVRNRAGMTPLSGVTTQMVMDEKLAELGTEMGARFYDMVRLGTTSVLNYEGRNFTTDKTFLPYPQNQVDQLPALNTSK
jgi:starch-binding outer membrane protein, SusD/RagB family